MRLRNRHLVCLLLLLSTLSAADARSLRSGDLTLGGRYISTTLAEKLIATLDEPTDKPLHELLSDREHEVMRMIAAGVPLTEIGERLHVSVKTISSYRTRVMEKMQMKSNSELTRYAMTHGLID